MNACHHPLSADLKALADGELSPWRSALLRRHLTRCPACREELDTMKRIADVLRPGTAAPLPDALRERLLAAAPTGPSAPKPRRWKPALAVGIAALACGAAFVAMYPRVQLPTIVQKLSVPPIAGKVSSEQLDTPRLYPKTSSDQDSNDPLSQLFNLHTRYSPETIKKLRQIPGVEAELRRRAGAGSGARIVTAPVPLTESRSGRYDVERIVHRTATLAIAVAPGQVEERGEKAEQAVVAAGGFVASSDLTTGEDALRQATLELRIPSKVFEETLRELARLGAVTARNVTSQDITDSTADARTADQVLAVEIRQAEEKLRRARRELTEIRREEDVRELRIRLAQNRARLERLRKMGTYGEVTLTIAEREKPAPKKTSSGFWDGMGETNQQASVAFQTAIRVPLVLGVWALAFAPVWLPLAFLWRWFSRRPAR